MTRPLRILASWLALALAMGACTSVREALTGVEDSDVAQEATPTQVIESPEPSDGPKDDASPSIEDLTLDDEDRDRRRRRPKDRKKNSGTAVAAPVGPSEVEQPPPSLEPRGDGGRRYATMSASVVERRPDGQRSGSPPDYAEARAVDIEGRGDEFRVTLSFSGQVPQRMPTSETYMVISFGMSGRDEDERDYGFGARATEEGWLAYAGSKGAAAQFPGTFFVRGDTIEMNIPWSAAGGPRPFEWYASSSWFAHDAGATSYLFDPIPNGKARYPN